jgi:hypothetical protein
MNGIESFAKDPHKKPVKGKYFSGHVMSKDDSCKFVVFLFIFLRFLKLSEVSFLSGEAWKHVVLFHENASFPFFPRFWL